MALIIGEGDAAAPGNGGGAAVKDVTTAGFQADVLQESMKQPVVVDLWAPWCGPCKQLGPILEKAVRATKGKVRMVKINIDEEPQIAQALRVQSIPAVFAFVNGQPVDGFMGEQGEAQVQAFIDKLIGPQGPSQAQLMLEEGEAALSAGDLQGAAAHFAHVLQAEPENTAAMAGMIRVYVAAGELETARQAMASLTEAMRADPLMQGAQAALDLAEKAAALGNPAELQARLALNEEDHQARFDLALLHNARGERLEAAAALVEIVKRDRSWQDDGARKELLQLFEAWGAADPASIAGRRQLSRVLFS